MAHVGQKARENEPMERSTKRILTTHTGSLPRAASIVEVLRRREHGEAVGLDEIEQAAASATREVVEQQLHTGLDIINAVGVDRIREASKQTTARLLALVDQYGFTSAAERGR